MARHAAPQSVVWSCWTNGMIRRSRARPSRARAGNRAPTEMSRMGSVIGALEERSQTRNQCHEEALIPDADLCPSLHPVVIGTLTALPPEARPPQGRGDEHGRPAARHRVPDVGAQVTSDRHRTHDLVSDRGDGQILVGVGESGELQTKRKSGFQQWPVTSRHDGDHGELWRGPHDRQHRIPRFQMLACPDPDVAHPPRDWRSQDFLVEAGDRAVAFRSEPRHALARGLIGGIAEKVDELELKLALDAIELRGFLPGVEPDEYLPRDHPLLGPHRDVHHRAAGNGGEIGTIAVTHDRGTRRVLVSPQHEAGAEQHQGHPHDQPISGPKPARHDPHHIAGPRALAVFLQERRTEDARSRRSRRLLRVVTTIRPAPNDVRQPHPRFDAGTSHAQGPASRLTRTTVPGRGAVDPSNPRRPSTNTIPDASSTSGATCWTRAVMRRPISSSTSIGLASETRGTSAGGTAKRVQRSPSATSLTMGVPPLTTAPSL